MKQIFKSSLNGWDESAERVYVYAIESSDEFWSFYTMSHEERCEMFGVLDESGYEVAPGAMYHTYRFELTSNYIIMIDTIALNV